MFETALQLIIIVTPCWESIHGQLLCLERESQAHSFEPIGGQISIVVGQKGMAWGLGLHPIAESLSSALIKREGDLKAPAGVFSLGPLFIDPRFPILETVSMPIVLIDQNWEAIDDPSSIYYNQLLDVTKIEQKDWTSSEAMQREDNLYHAGLIIHHNADPVIPGQGSCIFMHVWRSCDLGTHGCTALSLPNLKAVLAWLDPKKFPLMIQLPREEFLKKKREWQLPDIEGLYRT
jgi:hypothetical protein